MLRHLIAAIPKRRRRRLARRLGLTLLLPGIVAGCDASGPQDAWPAESPGGRDASGPSSDAARSDDDEALAAASRDLDDAQAEALAALGACPFEGEDQRHAWLLALAEVAPVRRLQAAELAWLDGHDRRWHLVADGAAAAAVQAASDWQWELARHILSRLYDSKATFMQQRDRPAGRRLLDALLAADQSAAGEMGGAAAAEDLLDLAFRATTASQEGGLFTRRCFGSDDHIELLCLLAPLPPPHRRGWREAAERRLADDPQLVGGMVALSAGLSFYPQLRALVDIDVVVASLALTREATGALREAASWMQPEDGPGDAEARGRRLAALLGGAAGRSPDTVRQAWAAAAPIWSSPHLPDARLEGLLDLLGMDGEAREESLLAARSARGDSVAEVWARARALAGGRLGGHAAAILARTAAGRADDVAASMGLWPRLSAARQALLCCEPLAHWPAHAEFLGRAENALGGEDAADLLEIFSLLASTRPASERCDKIAALRSKRGRPGHRLPWPDELGSAEDLVRGPRTAAALRAHLTGYLESWGRLRRQRWRARRDGGAESRGDAPRAQTYGAFDPDWASFGDGSGFGFEPDRTHFGRAGGSGFGRERAHFGRAGDFGFGRDRTNFGRASGLGDDFFESVFADFFSGLGGDRAGRSASGAARDRRGQPETGQGRQQNHGDRGDRRPRGGEPRDEAKPPEAPPAADAAMLAEARRMTTTLAALTAAKRGSAAWLAALDDLAADEARAEALCRLGGARGPAEAALGCPEAEVVGRLRKLLTKVHSDHVTTLLADPPDGANTRRREICAVLARLFGGWLAAYR